MDLFEILEKRYSCRDYSDKNVQDKDIFKIIKYASFAPSAGNLQPWHVIIVRNKEKRKSIAIASLNQTFMEKAPVHLVVCGNEQHVKKFYKAKGEIYCIQDCAAFSENILLLATSLGLSSCWVGAFDENMIKRELEMPESMKIYAIIALGYSNDKNPNSKKRYDMHSFTFFEKYGNKSGNYNILPLERHIPEMKEKGKNVFDKLVKHPK